MSAKNHFVIWKGVRTGPFTKEELEKEFLEGRMGLVRTVQVGGSLMSGSEFAADLEIKRREDELEEQLRIQEQQREAAQKLAEETRREADRERVELLRKLEEPQKRPAGKTAPPPVPDVNPWAPTGGSMGSGSSLLPFPNSSAPTSTSWWSGKGPVILAAVLCLVSLLTGQVLRELTGIAAIGLAVTLIIRKRTTSGSILIGCALLAYGLGFLLSVLIHEYISKNYPN